MFVSHQQPAASPTNSACTSWTVSLYLLEQGGSYLLQQAARRVPGVLYLLLLAEPRRRAASIGEASEDG